uniref:Uncharacterized protein n=1 Tax=Arundo donax TaxID=35708 RepID=A0A0A9GSI7_ARUDO
MGLWDDWGRPALEDYQNTGVLSHSFLAQFYQKLEHCLNQQLHDDKMARAQNLDDLQKKLALAHGPEMPAMKTHQREIAEEGQR